MNASFKPRISMSRSPSRRPLPALTQPARRRRSRRQTSPWRRLAQHTTLLELSARLGVNTFLVLVAAASLTRLVPHLQTQAQQLETVRQELDRAQTANTRLRSDFDRNFDPAQAGRVIQEQTGYRVPSERQVVWTD
ncbi:MAG: hypothetical protein DCF21_09380 [Leptolyngbya sp.]|uniref:Septum formation initiator n=1 Tax=Shackletoniella antarctica TaxID=268115 RepID=A0A2W4VU89_9CYAN|nr:MAG: hypothetical protein DCF17_17300 [Shackletoniella antarctica]PZV17496.1 MAG: hypothetical protein DCF21_09380 [Leptolyngbya sp.]